MSLTAFPERQDVRLVKLPLTIAQLSARAHVSSLNPCTHCCCNRDKEHKQHELDILWTHTALFVKNFRLDIRTALGTFDVWQDRICASLGSDHGLSIEEQELAVMWKLATCYDSAGDPLLHSLNGNIGRQVWLFDESAGSPAEREHIEKLRKKFSEKRRTVRHSSDELLRFQQIDTSKVRCRALQSNADRRVYKKQIHLTPNVTRVDSAASCTATQGGASEARECSWSCRVGHQLPFYAPDG
jgi:hypothetical protein